MWGRLGSPSEGEVRARVSLPPSPRCLPLAGEKTFKKCLNASFILPGAGNSIPSAGL